MYLTPLRLPKARILVLEEDAGIRAALCDLLIDAGYAIAGSANDENSVGHIDLVLANIGTQRTPSARPGLSDPTAPVIALVDHAAWSGCHFFDGANELGAVAVLQRPFSRTALLHLMANVLSDPTDDASAAQRGDADEAGLADLLLHLDTPRFV